MRNPMRNLCLVVIMGLAAVSYGQVFAEPVRPGSGALLLCHRTDNEDVPENTLESLEQAALLGCDVVEIDLRKTLDGEIVLNHDGFLERLTDGIGETERSYYDDLELRDAGAWMGQRFAHLHMALFEDALRLAKKRGVRLVLDIKTKGIGADVLMLVEREGMLERVQFGGEWADIKAIYPKAGGADGSIWVRPGVSAEEVKAIHAEGKAVIANFSANAYGMDLMSMKSAVAAGVDGINVDYPRLGADAVGRPVERTIATLQAEASAGEESARSEAILELSRYRGFPLQDEFERWLLDANDRISRAAALALVTARPRTPDAAFQAALRSGNPNARANAAWALGMLGADCSVLLPLLTDHDPKVLQEALMAIGRMSGMVSSQSLLPLLSHRDQTVRGAAAIALARHQPEAALTAVPAQLQQEVKAARVRYEDYERRGKPQLSPEEIAEITGYFRCEMKMVQAIAMLKSPVATQALEAEAFRPGEDFSQTNGLVAGFQLWDRIGYDALAARLAVRALEAASALVADRAEWMLIQSGPAVLPELRKALTANNPAVRRRAIRVVAWKGDHDSLGRLHEMLEIYPADAGLTSWAIGKITEITKASKSGEQGN
jgi:glycerophosphoryl diester phosphodiesterase/HEAT repeat protein